MYAEARTTRESMKLGGSVGRSVGRSAGRSVGRSVGRVWKYLESRCCKRDRAAQPYPRRAQNSFKYYNNAPTLITPYSKASSTVACCVLTVREHLFLTRCSHTSRV